MTDYSGNIVNASQLKYIFQCIRCQSYQSTFFGALASLHQPISEGVLGSDTFNIQTQPLNCPLHVFIVDQQLHLFRQLMVNDTKEFLQTKHIKAVAYLRFYNH